MKCPKCETNLDLVASVPDEQTVFFSIKYEGDWLAAATVAGTIKNADALMRAVAKEVGFKATCFVQSMEMKAHEVTIGLRVCRIKSNPSNK